MHITLKTTHNLELKTPEVKCVPTPVDAQVVVAVCQQMW